MSGVIEAPTGSVGTIAGLNPYSQIKAELHQCENIVLVTLFPVPKAMPGSHKFDFIWGNRKN